MSTQRSSPFLVSRRTRSPFVVDPARVRRIRSREPSRSSSGIIASGSGRPMSSSAVQPNVRSEAGFQTRTLQSRSNAWVATGDDIRIADRIPEVSRRRASAAVRSRSSDSAAASNALRRLVTRQFRASVKAETPANVIRSRNGAPDAMAAIPITNAAAGAAVIRILNECPSGIARVGTRRVRPGAPNRSLAASLICSAPPFDRRFRLRPADGARPTSRTSPSPGG